MFNVNILVEKEPVILGDKTNSSTENHCCCDRRTRLLFLLRVKFCFILPCLIIPSKFSLALEELASYSLLFLKGRTEMPLFLFKIKRSKISSIIHLNNLGEPTEIPIQVFRF